VPVLDVQNLRLLPDDPNAPAWPVIETDILIVGGGMGGCAAALAACRAGRNVVLTEETDWLGGQMTSQGVSAFDEHRFIETFGGTRSYYELRQLIRDYYRNYTRLTQAAASRRDLNPGNGWVSHLCFEPKAGLWALEQLLAPHVVAGRLRILLRHKAVRADVRNDRVRTVTFRNLDSDERPQIRASWFLDATELGDLLPLAGVEHVVGAEGREETGEPSARESGSAPACVQSFTYPFALIQRETPTKPLPEPPDYARNRDRQPYTLRHFYYDERGWVTYGMFSTNEKTPGSFWRYRRLVDGSQFRDAKHKRDVAMINWPGNDFRFGNLLAEDPADVLRSLHEARDLALGFCRYLQTECPRDEGDAIGYPELQLAPDVMGTATGLSKYPYVRESRRILAVTTVREQDISDRHLPEGQSRARLFPDSAGIGLYPIDIHPGEGEEKIPPDRARPFQIPLSSLVAVRVQNLLPACKNLGVTHITNGAYRLHPVEWNIGETAGLLAVFCLDRDLTPQAVCADDRRRRRFQRRLVRSGIPLHWYPDIPLDHPAFEASQVLAGWGIWTGDAGRLEFGPEETVGKAELSATSGTPSWARGGVHTVIEKNLADWSQLTRGNWAQMLYAAIELAEKRGR
jgi:hypothetical protein